MQMETLPFLTRLLFVSSHEAFRSRPNAVARDGHRASWAMYWHRRGLGKLAQRVSQCPTTRFVMMWMTACYAASKGGLNALMRHVASHCRVAARISVCS